MSRTSLPARRNRWRSAVAGAAIAATSFTVAACGGEEVGEETGVVEEGGVEEEPLEEEED